VVVVRDDHFKEKDFVETAKRKSEDEG